ncbi:MspI family type II restriction endonuclease [Acinetobacter sp. C26M]|uniref:MspI family type II restriction endonuclease n=1 Tax=unclassified Acinetobacter TaxID=196816 RepID=UPI002036AC2E|nr:MULTISPECIES: MspI family type II restriction endonuclease [unclassified Acinetobacter]USA46653.1 MspI family type II restriction endonuclease [Acinetobacter sp. C26M]USA50137.1 MspI family type II restriction endonuclease [Acinetobacter sp. C26G]
MRTELLAELYEEFGIDNLPLEQHGRTSDRLGKLYERYILEIFSDFKTMIFYSDPIVYPQESTIVNRILEALNIYLEDISDVSSSDSSLGRTIAGGLPKTDACITIHLYDGTKRLVPLNIKHSSKPKVSIAEYDVETICRGVGIPDGELKELMRKHQNDQSAKLFTNVQKQRLTELLEPYREQFIRWCVTLSAEKSEGNILHPDLLIRFKVIDREYVDVTITNIDDYISDRIAEGSKVRKPGFGTGLNWTYASGSGAQKMQFKG